MGVVHSESGDVDDPAYPRSSPSDAGQPGQTLEPLEGALEGIALPSVWSRLERPLALALDLIWDELGLFATGRPRRWVALHFGRIALNAHGWERLRARVAREVPDPELVPPPRSRLGLPLTWLEGVRAGLRARRLWDRVEHAEELGRAALERAGKLELDDLDNGELARGPLHDRDWLELLLPWLVSRLCEGQADEAGQAARIERAIHLEQRCSAQIGRRLVNDGVLHKPVDVAYLTIEERIRAVHEHAPYWLKLARTRARKVESFTEVEIPARFWGRPRVELIKDPLL